MIMKIILIALAYCLMFVSAYTVFDKSMRKNEVVHRKSIGISLSVFHSLCWLVFMFSVEDYESVIMPLAGVLIGAAIAISTSK